MLAKVGTPQRQTVVNVTPALHKGEQVEQTSHVMAKKRDKAVTEEGIFSVIILCELERKIESTDKKSYVGDILICQDSFQVDKYGS